LSESRCYGGTSRRHLVQTLAILALAVGYEQTILYPVTSWNEKAYEKFLRDAILGLIFLRGAAANIVLVQGPYRGTGTSSPLVFTNLLGSTPTNGNLLILAIANNSGNSGTNLAVTGITQTGVTWTYVNSISNFGEQCELWWGLIGSGTSKSITVTLSGNPASLAVVNVCEWSGITTVSPVDQNGTVANVTSPVTISTSGATTFANELVVVSAGTWNGGATSISSPSNGYTLLDGTGGSNVATSAYMYKIVTSTGTQSTTYTDSGAQANRVAVIATFKAINFISTSEAGTGTDLTVSLQPVLAPAESGTGTEALTPVNTPIAAESGIGSENDFPTYILTVTEVGTYTETDIRTTGVLPYYSPVVLEEGVFSEVFTVAVYTEVDVFESVAGTELLSTVGGPAINETGSGTDLPALSVTFTVADSGLGVEGWGLTASFTITETGSGAHGSSVSGGPGINETGTGTEKLTPGPLITTGESTQGTEITQSVLASLKSTDSGTFTEYILVPWPVPIVPEIGLAVELAYTMQGQLSVDGTSFSHVLTVQLDELVNMTNLPASDGLPNEVYQGGKGRKLTITGWTTDLAGELAMILGLANNTKHFFMLPTGESFYAYVSSVPKPKKAEDGAIYNYSFVAQEAID